MIRFRIVCSDSSIISLRSFVLKVVSVQQRESERERERTVYFCNFEEREIFCDDGLKFDPPLSRKKRRATTLRIKQQKEMF